MSSRESQNVNRTRFNAAGTTALGDALAATRRFASDNRLEPRAEARLCIIVEELITNMIEHGGGDCGQQISIDLVRQEAAVTLVIEDDGPAFDPRRAPDSDIPARGGGAGLRLVRAWAASIGYESEEGRNRLELTVPLAAD